MEGLDNALYFLKTENNPVLLIRQMETVGAQRAALALS